MQFDRNVVLAGPRPPMVALASAAPNRATSETVAASSSGEFRRYRSPMSLALFKDLCLDAADAPTLGEFWSAVLDLELHHQSNGDTYLTGETETHTLWINQVAEPKVAKHRIHLDIHSSSIDEVVALGASILDADSFPWTVMADPEGGEFCVFVRDSPPPTRLYEIVIDCADHREISRWWSRVLGGKRVEDDRGFSFIEGIQRAPFDNMSFVPVEEPKSTKNRIHIDVVTDDVAALIDAGAVLLRSRDDDIDWDVLADPEGNEFCARTTAQILDSSLPYE